MPITARQFARRSVRTAFTLVELLVVMGVLAMLSSLVLVGLASAAEQARANRTRSQIQKINELLMPRWEEYRYRRVEASKSGNVQARRTSRVDKIRQLMRMEMPCHIQDVEFGISNTSVAIGSETTEPALWRRYRRAVMNRAGSFSAWSSTNDDAECLYMIIESIQVGDTNGLDFFKPSEIGDTDDDGMPELLDGWGNPIHFIRWAPGFIGPRSNIHKNTSPDPFDPLGVRQGRLQTAGAGIYDHYPLFPLIVSEGPDEALDIRVKFTTTALTEATINGSPPNNPYYENSGARLGDEGDTNSNGVDEYFDNISNHQLIIAGNGQ